MFINTTVNGEQNNKAFSTVKSTNITINTTENLFTYSVPLLDSIQEHTTFNVRNISITMQLRGEKFFNTKTYILQAGAAGLQVQYNAETNTWSLATGLALQPV